MTPHDVVADGDTLLRFQKEVAYLDRVWPPDGEVTADAKILQSDQAVRIVAWLWPNPSYEPESDPFDEAWSARRSAAEFSGAEAIDRARRDRMFDVGRRFNAIVELVAQAVERTAEEVLTYLAWSVPISSRELARLRQGYAAFPFGLIVSLCDVLQLEFEDGWVLIDPRHLAGRIDESLVATEIADRLRLLGAEKLEGLLNRLPRGGRQPDVRGYSYRAPEPGSRYRSLYEALATTGDPAPVYSTDEIDALLVAAGEQPLPATARADRFWWSGTGERTEGRPQISAWWAAGYRVRHVDVEGPHRRVASVSFEALPGRDAWLTNPERIASGEYRPPEPERVLIYRHEHDLVMSRVDEQGLRGLADALGVLADAVERIKKVVDVMPPVLSTRNELGHAYLPSDDDTLELVSFLRVAGEADRSRIEEHLSQARDTDVDGAWMSNLLTRARRQGWIVNHGTRRQPRWASTGLWPLTILEIAEALDIDPPVYDPRKPVPVEFLRRVAQSLGVDVETDDDVEIGRAIVTALGGTWKPEFESASNTVTGAGLSAIRRMIPIPMPPDDVLS